MLEVEELRKSYGATKALAGISFAVRSGEIVGLIGLNGAGKTTTLHAIAGIIRADSGTIKIAGVDLATAPVAAKQQLAFLADEPEFFEYLTVEEHLALSRQLYPAQVAADHDPLMTFGLQDKRTHFPNQLSRGMRQKLAMACALWRSPQAIVLDEPLTGLDPVGMREVKQIVRSHAARGAAVLLSSHLLQLVQELCGRVILLSGGRLIGEHAVSGLHDRAPDSLERLLDPSPFGEGDPAP